jgi:hypothetical protein
MTTVTSVKLHSYKQARRHAGESYEADDKDIPVLLKLGWVTLGPAWPAVKASVPEPAPEPARRRNGPRRREYSRRDLEAEAQPRADGARMGA